MPATQIDKHPSGIEINFFEEGHRYEDGIGRTYTSCTGILKKFFPAFDADKFSKIVAERENTTPEAIKASWNKNRDEACRYGTRVHENGEWIAKGMLKRNEPENEKEKIAFEAIERVLSDFMSKNSVVAVEKIIFSPRLRVALTIDLLMTNGKQLIIADYKTNKQIRMDNNFNQYGLSPIEYLPDCEFSKYSLQLSMAEFLMKFEGYIPADTEVSRILVHIPPMKHDAVIIQTPYLESEILKMMIYHATRGFENVPF